MNILIKLRIYTPVAVANVLWAVASMLLEDGTTLHSKLKGAISSSIFLLSCKFLQVPIEVAAETFCSFTDAVGSGKLLQKASLLIIDRVQGCIFFVLLVYSYLKITAIFSRFYEKLGPFYKKTQM